MIPTGGVSLENAGEFIKAGSAALGVGSALVNNQVIADGRFDLLTETAKKLVEAVQIAKADQ